MKNSRIFAPLALVGAIFVAVAAALFVYAVPHPLWTTTSPKVQGDFEFLGVYKGMPRHLAKYGIDGFSDDYTGDLWAYFRVNRSNLGQVYSRIVGSSGAETAFTCRIKKSSPWPNGDAVYIGVPVPAEYPYELQNGKLELNDGKRNLGTWGFRGMASPKAAIDPLEPNKLRAEALGHRLELEIPISQRFGHAANMLRSADTCWMTRIRVSSGKLDPRDKYEYMLRLKRTTWSAPPTRGWSGSDLPANGFTYVSVTEQGCLPSKRIELAANIVRYRTAPDSITLHDVVLERDKDGLPDSQGYSVVRSSDKEIVSKEGIRFVLGASMVRHCGSKGQYRIELTSYEPFGKEMMANSSLSKTLKRPIGLHFGAGGTSNNDKKWEFTVWRDLPLKAAGKTITIKTLTLPFEHKAKLEERTVRFLGPTK